MKKALILLLSLTFSSVYGQESFQASYTLGSTLNQGYGYGNGVILSYIDLDNSTPSLSVRYNRFKPISDAENPTINQFEVAYSAFVPIKKQWFFRFDYGIAALGADVTRLDILNGIAISHIPKKQAIAFEIGNSFMPYTLFNYTYIRFGFTILP